MEGVQGETSKRQASSSLDDKSDNVFAALNFDPQLFTNDVRNAVDDIIDEGFGFFKEQAPKILGVKDDEVVEKLSKNHSKDNPDESPCEDSSSDMDLDSQLECLREKLVVAGRESAVLRGELNNLERQAAVTIRHAEALDNALQPLEENSTQDVINEFIRAASLLFGEKMERLKTLKGEKMEYQWIDRIRSPNIHNSNRKHFPGVEASVEDMQQFVNNFNGVYES